MILDEAEALLDPVSDIEDFMKAGRVNIEAVLKEAMTIDGAL